MKKQLTYIAPLKAGIVLAVLYTVGGLIGVVIAVPFLILVRTSQAPLPSVGVGWLILMPIVYGILGFVIGIISAALYNLVAKFTGGIEFEFKDVQRPPNNLVVN